MATNDPIDSKVNDKFLIIDKKLKDAFSSVKKDIAEIKTSLDKAPKANGRNIEKEIEQIKDSFDDKVESIKTELKKEIGNIKKVDYYETDLSDINKSIDEIKDNFDGTIANLRKEVQNTIKSIPKQDNEKLKLEKEILNLKVKEAREAQKNKSSGRISRLINRIGVWKEKHKLNKQYRKQLEEINNKHNQFEQELIEKTKQLDKLYSKSTQKAERKFDEEISKLAEERQNDKVRLEQERSSISREFSKSLAKIEERSALSLKEIEKERQNDKQFFIAQNEQTEKQRNQLIKEISQNINKSERRFEKLVNSIEERRKEDNSAVYSQLSALSDEIRRLQNEINILKGKKIKDEKAITKLEEDKLYLENKLKDAKSRTIASTKRSFSLPSLPKFSLPKFNFPKTNVKSQDLKEGFWLAVPYIFLAILAIVALNQYFHWDNISLNMTYWIIAGVLFGGLTFWHNRDKIESSMEDEKRDEDLAEQRRAGDFAYKFPRINKIWGIRSIVKWMYKEGFWYSVLLIFIILNGFLIRFDNLGTLPLQNDEFLTWDAVKYILSGNFTLTDLQYGADSASSTTFYSRSLPFSLGTAFFSHFVGDLSPFSLRLFSVIIGTLTIILFYIFLKIFKVNKLTRILTTYAFSVFYLFVYYSRVSRMYSLFVFLFILNLILFLKIIERIKSSKDSLFLDLKKNYFLILNFVIVSLIGLEVHLNFLFFFIIAFFVIMYESIFLDKLRATSYLLIILALLFTSLEYLNIFSIVPIWYFNILHVVNYNYITYSYQFFSGNNFVVILILSSLPLFILPKTDYLYKISFISFLCIMLFFIFLVNGIQFHDPRYIIFLYEFVIFISIYTISISFEAFNLKKIFKIVLAVLLTLVLIAPLQVSNVCSDSAITSCPISHESKIWTLDRWDYDYDEIYNFIKSNLTKEDVIIGRAFYPYYLEVYNITNPVYQLANAPTIDISLIKNRSLIFVDHPKLIFRTPEIENNQKIYLSLIKSNKTLIYNSEDNKTLIYRLAIN